MQQFGLPIAVSDLLSPAAKKVLAIADESDVYGGLVPTEPGSAEARTILAGLSSRNVLATAPVTPDTELDAATVLSGLWLLHDFLRESHQLAQDVDTSTGSFWHAIMHRREADFSNSKYWYARCAGHSAITTLAGRAAQVVRASPLAPSDAIVAAVVAGGGWSSRAWVDLVESVYDRPEDPMYELAVQLQRLEWGALFEHSVRAAAAVDRESGN